MTTLSKIAPLLDRLFAESATSDAALRERFGQMSADERRRRMQGGDYREMYGRMRDSFLAVSPETGRLLYMLARAANAKVIVEFGTSFGLSTLHLAAALRDNGGGKLIGSELEPTKAAKARAHLAQAELADLVEIREGDALETLAKDVPASVDVVLMDGHKPLYPRILELLAPSLHAGSWLVADNIEAAPEYLAVVRGPGFVSAPFSDEVEVTLKL